MEHQDTKLTSMRPRLKELNDNPYHTCRVGGEKRDGQETDFYIVTLTQTYGMTQEGVSPADLRRRHPRLVR